MKKNLVLLALGKNVSELRNKKELTQEQLAERSGLDHYLHLRLIIQRPARRAIPVNIEKVFGEEQQKIRKESDPIRLNSRYYEFGNGVYCDLRVAPDGGVIIDRLFVPEDLRGHGLHKNMLLALVRLAEEADVELSMAVAPDRLEGEALDSPRYNKVTDALVLSAMELGFKPYRDGEDVYRLDLTYKPGICRDKKNKTGDICGGSLLASAHEFTGSLFKKHHGEKS